jgi:2-polyprenyl-6-methoxyphenol hydroxylase-like FAD-dependent oxidoreductase
MAAEILIVGAGPNGLFAAHELVRHGLEPRIIDKKEGPSIHSKALGVHIRTQELWARSGLLEEALAHGRKLYGMNMYAGGKRIAHIDMGELDTPYPHVLVLPQSETEKMLVGRLALAGIRVEWQVECTGIAGSADGVTATLKHADGAEERAGAKWLLGCDGAHSTVREALGVPYQGENLDTTFTFADLPLVWDMDPNEGHNFFGEEGVLLCLGMPREGWWRIIASLPAGAAPPELSGGYFETLIRDRAGKAAVAGEPEWMTHFGLRQRRARHYRRGRVFLMGDSAHCHSPLGGQGMNTGMQDVANLVWKLVLVAKGVGRSELLDSYGIEREPVADDLLVETASNTRLANIRGTLPQAIRNSVVSFASSLEVVRQRLARSLSKLSVEYRKSPLVAEDRTSLLGAQVGGDRSVEHPSFGDVRDFGAAPRAGDRLPPASFGPEGAERALWSCLHATRSNLLLFDGMAATEAGYVNLSEIARAVRAGYGEHLEVHVVTPTAECPAALDWDGSLLADPGARLHDCFGAGAECLYLIRPDLYVGYRAQPADKEKLLAYLRRIFI